MLNVGRWRCLLFCQDTAFSQWLVHLFLLTLLPCRLPQTILCFYNIHCPLKSYTPYLYLMIPTRRRYWISVIPINSLEQVMSEYVEWLKLWVGIYHWNGIDMPRTKTWGPWNGNILYPLGQIRMRFRGFQILRKVRVQIGQCFQTLATATFYSRMFTA